MAIYDDTGELRGYRWADSEPPKRHKLWRVGTHIIFPKNDSQSLSIAVTIA